MLMPAWAAEEHLMFWSKVNTTVREAPSTSEMPSAGLVDTSAGAGDTSGSGSGFSPQATARKPSMSNNADLFFIAIMYIV